MKQYSYDGPVLEFDRCIANHWKASTFAASESKARCNLAYRYKQENNKAVTAKISLPGKLVLVE